MRNYYTELYLCHQESFREKHDLTDLLQIRYNTHHWSKECFDALRELCTACITRVHGDKDSHTTVQRYLGTFKLLRQNGHMSEPMGFTLLKARKMTIKQQVWEEVFGMTEQIGQRVPDPSW